MKKIFYSLLFISIASGLLSSCAGARGTRVGDCPSHDKNYFIRH